MGRHFREQKAGGAELETESDHTAPPLPIGGLSPSPPDGSELVQAFENPLHQLTW